jgi:hypothetical protein
VPSDSGILTVRYGCAAPGPRVYHRACPGAFALKGRPIVATANTTMVEVEREDLLDALVHIQAAVEVFTALNGTTDSQVSAMLEKHASKLLSRYVFGAEDAEQLNDEAYLSHAVFTRSYELAADLLTEMLDDPDEDLCMGTLFDAAGRLEPLASIRQQLRKRRDALMGFAESNRRLTEGQGGDDA